MLKLSIVKASKQLMEGGTHNYNLTPLRSTHQATDIVLSITDQFSGSIPNSYFGPGTGLVLLSNMECSGDERNLTDCPHGGIGNNFCSHQGDAGVACKGVCMYK